MRKRRYTRSVVWPNTDASIKVQKNINFDKMQKLTIKGKVENLGSSGMFLLTDELVPVPAFADITINFDPESGMSDMMMTASGKTVRLTKNGVGIRFTSIDLKKLQKCIIRKINGSAIAECDFETLV